MARLEQYKELQQSYRKIGAELSEFVRQNQRGLLNDLASELKAIPGMNKMVVKGYTPGFNDGDACTHSSDVYYNKTYHFSELSEEDVYGLGEFLGAPEDIDDDLYEWVENNPINTFSEDDSKEIGKIASMLDSLIEEIYDTDYIVFIDLTTNEPTITYKDYYCGY